MKGKAVDKLSTAPTSNAAENKEDNASTLKTAETLAKEHHVSERTIRRDGKRAEAGPGLSWPPPAGRLPDAEVPEPRPRNY